MLENYYLWADEDGFVYPYYLDKNGKDINGKKFSKFNKETWIKMKPLKREDNEQIYKKRKEKH